MIIVGATKGRDGPALIDLLARKNIQILQVFVLKREIMMVLLCPCFRREKLLMRNIALRLFLSLFAEGKIN